MHENQPLGARADDLDSARREARRLLWKITVAAIGGLLGFLAFVVVEYRYARDEIVTMIGDKAMAVAQLLALEVEQEIDEYLLLNSPADVDRPAFKRLHALFLRTRDTLGLRFVYTEHLSEDGTHIIYGVDGRPLDDPEYSKIGEKEYDVNEFTREAHGRQRPVYGPLLPYERWGTVLTGYAPFRDRDGNFRGMVGVDVDASRVAADLARIKRNMLLLGVGGTALIAGAFSIILALVNRLHIRKLMADRAEAVLREREEELRQASKLEAVGRLATGIAQDFDDVLTVVRGRSDLLLERLAGNDPTRAPVETIARVTDRAVELTRQLLAFGRRQILEPRPLDLNEVLASIEPMLRRSLGQRVELSIISGTGLGKVDADRGQIEQVILNLLISACDAMPEGGRITIETANVELDEVYARTHEGVVPGAHVTLTVSDTGVEIDAEARTRLFEPFLASRGSGRGGGLALATVYGIVTQSQGHIYARSEPGVGSRFEIYLPRVDAAMDSDGAGAESPSSAPSGATILLVEDDDDVRDLAREILQMSGYRILSARHAAEALGIADRHGKTIDLLVTEVAMPEMSGSALAQRLLSRQPSLRVLYVASGPADDTIVHAGVVTPGTSLLSKPFLPRTLVRRVAEALRAPRSPGGAREGDRGGGP